MSRFFTAFALTALLAGCDSSNPFQADESGDTPIDNGGDTPIIDEGEEVSSTGIPVALSGVNGAVNLESVSYDPDNQSLAVDLAALDRTDSDIPLQDYAFNANLTALAPGYEVYSFQDDGLDRMFVAIVAQSDDGSVLGAAVMDGGQFNRFFGGGFYATDGNYSPGRGENDTGLVSYAGTYAALTNIDADGAELLGVPAGTDPQLLPSQPAQITGDIFFNADFGDNTINGAIINRAFENLNPLTEAVLGTSDLDNVVLIPTAITDTGTFFGSAENPAQEAVGSYGGTFGGTEASGVAGVTALDGDWIPALENEHEFGVFVLTQCGQPGDAAICDNIPVNPL